jgi:hypothetical protein
VLLSWFLCGFRRRYSLVVLHDHGPLRVAQTLFTPLLLHQQHLWTLLLEETGDRDYTDILYTPSGTYTQIKHGVFTHPHYV